MSDQSTVHKFDHGLTTEQEDTISDLQSRISTIVQEVEALPRHRNLSLTITKLEEANLWLRNRLHKPAS